MSARYRVLALFLIAFVIIGGVTARGHAAPLPASGETVRVGYFPNITHAQAVLGFGSGAFARGISGVTVHGIVFTAGPDELNALFAGVIDIGYIGPGPAINGFVRAHGGLSIVAGVSSAGAMLVARKGTGITSVKDLAGKKVAIPQLGNTQDIELRALLSDAGLTPTENGGSVRILSVQNPDALSLFQRGDLDAALAPEPWASRLVASTGASIVLNARQIYGGALPAAVIIVSTAFLKAHPDLVVRFLRVHNQLTRQLQQVGQVRSSEEAALNVQIKTLTGKPLSASILRSALSNTTFSTSIDQTLLNRFATYSIRAGYLPKDAAITGLLDPWPLAHLADPAIQ